jgi:hypothetical protein
VLTISSSLNAPESAPGRVIDVVLSLYAVGFLGTMLSVIVRWLHRMEFVEGRMAVQQMLKRERAG